VYVDALVFADSDAIMKINNIVYLKMFYFLCLFCLQGYGGDIAAVALAATKQGMADGMDVVLIDTAVRTNNVRVNDRSSCDVWVNDRVNDRTT
jgi:hypothetical protein